jgi:hypothetical protein
MKNLRVGMREAKNEHSCLYALFLLSTWQKFYIYPNRSQSTPSSASRSKKEARSVTQSNPDTVSPFVHCDMWQ